MFMFLLYHHIKKGSIVNLLSLHSNTVLSLSSVFLGGGWEAEGWVFFVIAGYHFIWSLCIPRSFTNHYAEKMLVGAR